MVFNNPPIWFTADCISFNPAVMFVSDASKGLISPSTPLVKLAPAFTTSIVAFTALNITVPLFCAAHALYVSLAHAHVGKLLYIKLSAQLFVAPLYKYGVSVIVGDVAINANVWNTAPSFCAS